MADQRALRTVRAATVRRAKSEDAWRKSIREAHAYGCSLREIAAEAGVAHTRVLQIVREQH
jgi:hypothetical protein